MAMKKSQCLQWEVSVDKRTRKETALLGTLSIVIFGRRELVVEASGK